LGAEVLVGDEVTMRAEEQAAMRLKELEGRRREGRMLLAQFVRYVRAERTASNTARLYKLCDTVADYLNRTSEPADILRDEATKPAGTPSIASALDALIKRPRSWPQFDAVEQETEN
jgi:hypothetical protein